jgi:hypothetical protein
MPSDGKSSHCLWQGELKNCIIKCLQNIHLQSVYIEINLYKNKPMPIVYEFLSNEGLNLTKKLSFS